MRGNINRESCGQSACIMCISKNIQDCSKCDDGFILNRKTGECIPVLTIYSFGSIKIIGMLIFFFIIFINLPTLQILKELKKTERSIEPICSIMIMMQTVLIITHFNTSSCDEWIKFIDGFQYFKFNLRFLNPVFNLRNKMNGHQGEIPNRMYDLLLEDRSALICFINLFLAISFALFIRFVIVVIKNLFNRKVQFWQSNQNKLSILKNILNENKFWRIYIDMGTQYFMLCSISEVIFTFSWMTPISLAFFTLMFIYKYCSIYLEIRFQINNKWRHLLFSIITDTKRVIFNALFFCENQWYSIIIASLFVQILEIAKFFFNDLNYKTEKAIIITNEVFTTVFCGLLIFLLNCSSLHINSNAVITTIGIVSECILILILIAEVGLITFQNTRDIIKWCKSKLVKTKVEIINYEIAIPSVQMSKINIVPEEFESQNNTPRTYNKGNTMVRFQLDMHLSAKNISGNIQDFDNSINAIKKKKRISLPNRIEESKYHDKEASEKNVIIERISNNHNDTLSSSSKNYSNNSDLNSPSVKSQKPRKKRNITLNKNSSIIRKASHNNVLLKARFDNRAFQIEGLHPAWQPRAP